MVYGWLADAVVLAHCAFVLFVVFGGLLVLRWRGIVWFHLPAAAWGVVVEFTGWICPLTPLEMWLRRGAGEAGYGGGFVEHYVTRALYPVNLTRQIQIVLGSLILAFNAAVYWRVRRRAR